jgi:hypothetical protein
MFRWLGFWAQSKGMTKVPNLIGLSKASAESTLMMNGLAVGTETTIDTDVSADNNKVSSQTIPADQLVDYETPINFVYQVFSFTPYSFTPQAYSFTPYTFTPYTFTPYTFTPSTPTTYYWATGCCDGVTSSTQVSATSTVSTSSAQSQLTGQCSGTLRGVQTGSYSGASNIPSLTCCINYDSGYQWVTCNGSSVYLPTTTNSCTGGVMYTCPSSVWYCSTRYYNTGLPNEQYVSYTDDTGSYCSDSNTVCSQTGYPPYPSRPPACSTYSFTPYTFTPYTFTPYSFTPQAYSFTPYTFTPYTFTPVPAYSFTPLRYCIDQDTPIMVVGNNDSIAYKKAEDIRVGDYIWSATWDQFIDENYDPYAMQHYGEMTGEDLVISQIISIEPSSKSHTFIINGDYDKRFTAEEMIFIKRNDNHMFDQVQNLTQEDSIYEIIDGLMTVVRVDSVEAIDQARTVYKFNASPTDTIIAGNMVVHNSKS